MTRSPLLLGCIVSAAAFLWLDRVTPAPAITDDAVRDILLARDCTELGRCSTIGASASLRGFHQGAVRLGALVAVRLLGGGVHADRTLALVLLALAAGTVFVAASRRLRPQLALPAAVLFLAGVPAMDYQLTLLPDVLAAAALFAFAQSGAARYLAVAAFALGMAAGVHVGSLTLVPSLLALAVLAGRRVGRDVAAAFAVFAATYFLTSRAAAVANLEGLAEHGRLLPLGAAAALCALLPWPLRERFARLLPERRAAVAGFALLLPFAAGAIWLTAWQRHELSLAYLHPVLAPAAAALAALAAAGFERFGPRRSALAWRASAVLAFAVALLAWRDAAQQREAVRQWTFEEASAVAGQARQLGWSYEDLVFRVQSSSCRELLIGMSVASPPTPETVSGPSTTPAGVAAVSRWSSEATPPGRRSVSPGVPARSGTVPSAATKAAGKQLQVLRAGAGQLAALPASARLVPLGAGGTALVREIDAWLRPGELLACVAAEGSAERRCVRARQAGGRLSGGESFAARAYPEVAHLELPPRHVTTYEVPLVPVAGESRDVVLAESGPDGCGWRIVGVEGFEVEGTLPSDRVRLRSVAGAPGRLVFERHYGTAACPTDVLDRRYPPCVFESPPGDPLWPLVEGRAW